LLDAANPAFIIGQDGTHYGSFQWTNANNLLRINTNSVNYNISIGDLSGNVGIGTTTPNEKLTVSGNTDVSGTVDASEFTEDGSNTLTNDISGNAATATTASSANDLSCTNCIGGTEIDESSLSGTAASLTAGVAQTGDSATAFFSSGAIEDAYIIDTITASNYVRKNTWTDIDSYPTACSAGSYVSGLADTLSCTADPLDTIAEWQTLCTNCVESGDANFNYAGSSSKGGAATALSCTDCIGTTEISDVYFLNTGDTLTGGVSGSDPTPQLILSNYYDNAGNPSISHIKLYDGYGFGVSSSTLSYISDRYHKFYDSGDLTNPILTINGDTSDSVTTAHDLYVGMESSTDNDYIYFDETGAGGDYIYYNNAADRFYTSTTLYVVGDAIASGKVCGNRFMATLHGTLFPGSGNLMAANYTSLDTEGKTYTCLDCRMGTGTDIDCSTTPGASWYYCEFSITC